jgi:hypothetical protein
LEFRRNLYWAKRYAYNEGIGTDLHNLLKPKVFVRLIYASTKANICAHGAFEQQFFAKKKTIKFCINIVTFVHKILVVTTQWKDSITYTSH